MWWYVTRGGNSKNDAPATTVAGRRDMSLTVLATGSIKPQVGAEVRVGARISGKVEQLHANIGDTVKKGQVIAELEKADLTAVVNQRKAEFQLAEKDLARQEELLKQDFASKQTRDEVLARRDVSKAALEAARVKLSYATITAPIDGVIASVSTQEGETVAAGLNAPTFVTIIDLNRLQVDAFVDEVDIGRIETGQRTLFTVDTFPGRDFGGEINTIYPKAVIQENVVNYDVVVSITNRYERLLRPEMTANVTIFLETRQDVLTLPAQAIQREHGKNLVYVQTPDGVEGRPVTVGQRDGQWVEVIDGVAEHETVLLESPNTDLKSEDIL
ncbi:MAG: efflux RND transporter periplasmic adaptor subunit [Planctomycetes bacterium]|nr:efflux RND transporter periplasmic adaptor subunit [Planctomycetota bacterium]